MHQLLFPKIRKVRILPRKIVSIWTNFPVLCKNFDGSCLTISSNGKIYTFDVSQTRLECKYGVVLSDNVSVIYEGQLSGTDISTISPIKITDQYHNETPLEDRTLKGKVKRLTSNALVIVTEKGNTVTFPVTGVKQYYKRY